MKPGKNLIISFLLILIFSLYFFILSYHNKKQSEIVNKWVIHSQLVVEQITDFNILITEFEAQDQSNVITISKDSDKDLITHYLQGTAKFNTIRNLVAGDKRQQQNLENVISVLTKKTAYVNNVFSVLKKSQSAALALLAAPESKKLYAETKNILASMLYDENNLLKKRTAEYDKALQKRFNYSIAFAILGLILFTTAFIKTYEESTNRKIAEDDARKSEGKYKGLIEKSSLIIFTTDLQGRFTYISDRGLRLTGYKMEELAGVDFNILLPKNHKNEITKFFLNQYSDSLKDVTEEFEIKTKNNHIKAVELSAVLIKENRKIVGFQGLARDITEVKYVESLIKESKANLQHQQEEYSLRLQSVINNIPMMLYIKDLQGKYLVINKNFMETFGVNNEMVIGKKNSEIKCFSKKGDFYDDIDERVKTTGRPIEFEEVINTMKGDRNLMITKFPLLDKNNNVFAISGVAKDVTEKTQQKQELIDARLKAEKAEQLQEAFLANMSHEIRTPMNGIMGMTNMLIDTQLNDEQKEYTDLIKKSSDTLLILINDILDLSKIKAGRMELEVIDFNIKEAVQNVLLPMKVSLKKNIVLDCAISSSVPHFVKGDSHKLFQILNNLVSNAIKFTEKGKIKVDVSAGKKNEEEIFIKFDVSDTGIGISEEYIKNIFENFTQVGNDTVRRFGGTGLGLAITKKLTELQNGTIRVESSPGSGSVFHVEIPYVVSDVQTALPEKSNIDINFIREGISNKRILIVEDNAVNQRVLTSVLQKIKAVWDISGNGKEAIDKLETGNVYDLIIMDLQMPLMDGFEAAEYIRKKLKMSIPIIAMTASTLRNEKIKCFEIGMNDYLAKPFSPDELIKRIYSVINPLIVKEEQMEYKQIATEKLYDLAYLDEMDDNEYSIEMIELFFETVSEGLKEMDNDVKNKNWDAVFKGAHKIKSSLGPLQVNKMISIASLMEENAKHGKNLDEIANLNKELNVQYSAVKPLIEAELVKAKETSSGFVNT